MCTSQIWRNTQSPCILQLNNVYYPAKNPTFGSNTAFPEHAWNWAGIASSVAGKLTHHNRAALPGNRPNPAVLLRGGAKGAGSPGRDRAASRGWTNNRTVPRGLRARPWRRRAEGGPGGPGGPGHACAPGPALRLRRRREGEERSGAAAAAVPVRGWGRCRCRCWCPCWCFGCSAEPGLRVSSGLSLPRAGRAGGEGARGDNPGAAAGRRDRDRGRYRGRDRDRDRALLPPCGPRGVEGALGACPGGPGGGRKEMALGRWWNHEGLGGCGRVWIVELWGCLGWEGP